MNQYDELCLNYFLKHQSQLFREEVASTQEEIEEASEVFSLPDGRYLVVEV